MACVFVYAMLAVCSEQLALKATRQQSKFSQIELPYVNLEKNCILFFDVSFIPFLDHFILFNVLMIRPLMSISCVLVVSSARTVISNLLQLRHFVTIGLIVT